MDKKVIDVDYQNIDNDGSEKTPTFLSIGEVARELGEKTSRIRYWDEQYSEFLDTDRSGNGSHRRFSKQDVAKLRLIQEMWHNNYSHEHIKNEIREFKFDEDNMTASININGTSGQLQVQMLATALLEVMKEELNQSKDSIVKEVSEKVQHSNDKLREEVCVTLDDRLEDFKVQFIKEFNDSFNNEIQARTETNEKMDNLKLLLEERKEEYNNNNKKGFLSRLLGK